MTRRRLVFILRHFTVGGLERVVLAQVPALLDAGFPVTVVVLHPGRDNALVAELDPRADLVVADRSRLRRAIQIRDAVRGNVVLIHFGDGKLFPTIRPALGSAAAIVRFCHSDYSHTRSAAKNRFDRFLSRREDRIVAVGGRSTRFLLDDVGVDAGKVTTLPNAIPRREASHAVQWSTGDELLVSIASFYPHKGHDSLLRGFAKVAAARPGARLALIGDGSETIPLRQLAAELRILDRVTWLGGLWNQDVVHSLLASAAAFVSMSRFEGIPISVLEGRQHGLPMVLSDIPGHRDGGGETARYVPVDDIDAFAAAVTDVLDGERPTALNGELWTDYVDRLVAILDDPRPQRDRSRAAAARPLPVAATAQEGDE